MGIEQPYTAHCDACGLEFGRFFDEWDDLAEELRSCQWRIEVTYRVTCPKCVEIETEIGGEG